MKPSIHFDAAVSAILQKDSRYARGAYHFIRQALAYTAEQLKKKSAIKGSSHIKGGDLLLGLRDYAIEQYGPMAFALLQTWGIKNGEDCGRIVFNLVDYGLFSKTEDDTLDDFKGVIDFKEAFIKPFLPKNLPVQRVGRRTKRRAILDSSVEETN